MKSLSNFQICFGRNRPAVSLFLRDSDSPLPSLLESATTKHCHLDIIAPKSPCPRHSSLYTILASAKYLPSRIAAQVIVIKLIFTFVKRERIFAIIHGTRQRKVYFLSSVINAELTLRQHGVLLDLVFPETVQSLGRLGDLSIDNRVEI